MGKKNSDKSKKIDIGKILKGMDYLAWDHPTVMKGFRVAKEIQVWLDKQYADPEKVPHVIVSICSRGILVVIGDIMVWDSDDGEEKDLNFTKCVDVFKQEILRLMVPFE